MTTKVPLETFTDAFKNSHGADGAAALMAETVKKLSLEGQEEFTKDEAVRICMELQNKSGFVGVVAGILLTRFGKDTHE